MVHLLSSATVFRVLEIAHLFNSSKLATAAIDYTVDELLGVMLPEPYAKQACEETAAARKQTEIEKAVALAAGRPAPPEVVPDYSNLQRSLVANINEKSILKYDCAEWLDQPHLRPVVEPLVKEAIERYSATDWEDLLATGTSFSQVIHELCVDIIMNAE